MKQGIQTFFTSMLFIMLAAFVMKVSIYQIDKREPHRIEIRKYLATKQCEMRHYVNRYTRVYQCGEMQMEYQELAGTLVQIK